MNLSKNNYEFSSRSRAAAEARGGLEGLEGGLTEVEIGAEDLTIRRP